MGACALAVDRAPLSRLELPCRERQGEVCLRQPEADKLDEEVLGLLVLPFLCLQSSWLRQLRELHKQGSACAKFGFS